MFEKYFSSQHFDTLLKIFFQILQIQMNNYKYHYHFTTFDIEAHNLENFRYNFVNMTAFRMIDLENPLVKQIIEDMNNFHSFGPSIISKKKIILVSMFLS